MNRTPPVAWLNFAVVRGAVWPVYCADQVGPGHLDQVAVGDHLELG